MALDEKEIAKIAAEAGARAALEQAEKIRKEQAKHRGDRRLRNTRLLFKNYDLLKAHCENAIFDKDTLLEDDGACALDILDSIDDLDARVYIDAIRRSVSRTKIILAHIEQMIEVYRILCDSSQRPEEKRRWRIFYTYNIEKMKIKDIVEAEHIDRSTYYRDVAVTMKTLSALIFGVEGLTSVRQMRN